MVINAGQNRDKIKQNVTIIIAPLLNKLNPDIVENGIHL